MGHNHEDQRNSPMPQILRMTEPNKVYVSDDGHTMQREWGTTPNGNPIANRWVLRNQLGEFLDVDQYRNDLAERFDLVLEGI